MKNTSQLFMFKRNLLTELKDNVQHTIPFWFSVRDRIFLRSNFDQFQACATDLLKPLSFLSKSLAYEPGERTLSTCFDSSNGGRDCPAPNCPPFQISLGVSRFRRDTTDRNWPKESRTTFKKILRRMFRTSVACHGLHMHFLKVVLDCWGQFLSRHIQTISDFQKNTSELVFGQIKMAAIFVFSQKVAKNFEVM